MKTLAYRPTFKFVTFTLFCFIFMTVETNGQSRHKKTLQYLHQEPPGMKPEIFAPGIVSLSDQHEFGSTFSADGKEFYFGVDVNGKAETRFMRLENGQWTKPQPIFIHETYSFNDPCFSVDEKKIYVISDRPTSGNGPKEDYDIWYFERKGTGWSEPVNAGPAANSDMNEYYISFTRKGSMYYSSNRGKDENSVGDYDIRSASFTGAFKNSVKLSDAVNTVNYEGDVFVAPDESYVIFCTERANNLGKGDLFISFRDMKGHWLPAKSMGNAINTTAYEFCPFVTRDGKYFFYTSNRDIYWVDARIIDTLR